MPGLASVHDLLSRAKRVGPPALLLALVLRRRSRTGVRLGAAALLLALWGAVYAKYRRLGRAQTQREYEQLRGIDWATFSEHYNDRVPTIEEEFEIWGEYHQHRHEMRYDL